MEKESMVSKMDLIRQIESNMKLDDMRKYGITSDFFNQFSGIDPMKPRMLKFFIKERKERWFKTYSEKYKNQSEVLEKSDPEKVKKLDSLVEKIDKAVNEDNLPAVKKLLVEFLLYWNELGFKNVKDEYAEILKEELENIGE